MIYTERDWAGRHRGFFIFSIALLLVLSGCATRQLANEEDDRIAKEFNPPADKSHIYIFRRSAMRGQAIHMSISLDREVAGAIQNKTYLLLIAEPGTRVIEIGNSVSSENPKIGFLKPIKLELETLPGRVYFIGGNLTMGQPNMAIVPEVDGKQELLQGGYHRVDTVF